MNQENPNDYLPEQKESSQLGAQQECSQATEQISSSIQNQQSENPGLDRSKEEVDKIQECDKSEEQQNKCCLQNCSQTLSKQDNSQQNSVASETVSGKLPNQSMEIEQSQETKQMDQQGANEESKAQEEVNLQNTQEEVQKQETQKEQKVSISQNNQSESQQEAANKLQEQNQQQEIRQSDENTNHITTNEFNQQIQQSGLPEIKLSSETTYDLGIINHQEVNQQLASNQGKDNQSEVKPQNASVIQETTQQNTSNAPVTQLQDQSQIDPSNQHMEMDTELVNVTNLEQNNIQEQTEKELQSKKQNEEATKESITNTVLNAQKIVGKHQINLQNLLEYFSIVVEQFQKQMQDFEYLNELRNQVDQERQNQQNLNEGLMQYYNRYQMCLEELKQRYIEDCMKMWLNPVNQSGYQRAVDKSNNQIVSNSIQIIEQIRQKVNLSENNLQKANQTISQLDKLIQKRDNQLFTLTQQKQAKLECRSSTTISNTWKTKQYLSDNSKSKTQSFMQFFNLRSDEIQQTIQEMQGQRQALIFEDPQSKAEQKNSSKSNKKNKSSESQDDYEASNSTKKQKLSENKKGQSKENLNHEGQNEANQSKKQENSSANEEKKTSNSSKSKQKDVIDLSDNEDTLKTSDKNYPHKVKNQDSSSKGSHKSSVKSNEDHANEILNMERGFDVDKKYLEQFNDKDLVDIVKFVQQKMTVYLQKCEKGNANEINLQYDVIAWHNIIQQIMQRKKLKQQKKLIKECETLITKVCKQTNQ